MKAPAHNLGKYQIMAEINMIPLIDVALVLLIIFMVMTPYLVRSQIKVDLPKSPTSDASKSQQQCVTVQIQRNGNLYVDGRFVTTGALEGVLRASLVGHKNKPVMIESDRDAPVRHVVQVLGVAKKVGIANLGVAVLDEGKGKPGAR